EAASTVAAGRRAGGVPPQQAQVRPYNPQSAPSRRSAVPPAKHPRSRSAGGCSPVHLDRLGGARLHDIGDQAAFVVDRLAHRLSKAVLVAQTEQSWHHLHAGPEPAATITVYLYSHGASSAFARRQRGRPRSPVGRVIQLGAAGAELLLPHAL